MEEFNETERNNVVITGMGIKEGSIVIGIISSLLLGGMSLGKQSQSLADTKEVIVEIKDSVKENQKINVEQTIALTKQSVILEGVVKTQEKQNQVLEKLLDK